MGKIRTKEFGDEAVEKAQKLAANEKVAEKKEKKKLSIALKASLDEATEVAVEEGEMEAPKEEKKDTKTEKIVAKKSKTSKKHVGKNILAARKMVDKNKMYTLTEAIEILKKTDKFKGKSSVELHLQVNEESLKGEVKLPHGTGKEVRVVEFSDEIASEISSGKINFDVLLASPSQMATLAKFAKVLGPRGLMPNPKSGTVTEDMEGAKKKFAGGTIRYKTESKFPLIHLGVGKLEFENEQLVENILALLKSVSKKNIKTAHISSTMGPGIQLELGEI